MRYVVVEQPNVAPSKSRIVNDFFAEDLREAVQEQRDHLLQEVREQSTAEPNKLQRRINRLIGDNKLVYSIMWTLPCWLRARLWPVWRTQRLTDFRSTMSTDVAYITATVREESNYSVLRHNLYYTIYEVRDFDDVLSALRRGSTIGDWVTEC